MRKSSADQVCSGVCQSTEIPTISVHDTISKNQTNPMTLRYWWKIKPLPTNHTLLSNNISKSRPSNPINPSCTDLSNVKFYSCINQLKWSRSLSNVDDKGIVFLIQQWCLLHVQKAVPGSFKRSTIAIHDINTDVHVHFQCFKDTVIIKVSLLNLKWIELPWHWNWNRFYKWNQLRWKK